MLEQTRGEVRLVRAEIDDETLLCDLCDSGLRADAYIPRGQMRAILLRSSSTVYLITYDDELCGFAIMYTGRTLHNMFIVDWARHRGVGKIALKLLNPEVIRSKSNMKAGDPRTFYERNGYGLQSLDTAKPHIEILEQQSTVVAQSEHANVTIGKEELAMLQESHRRVKSWREKNKLRARMSRVSKSQDVQGTNAV